MRNIHFSPEPTANQTPAEVGLPRLREITNDPLTEYAQRPGEVERLPDSVAAIILCKTGANVVERHQIKIVFEGEEMFFANPDSIIIPVKNGTEEKVLWAMNRLRRDAIHIFSAKGQYIETIQRKGEAAWFSNDSESKRAMADAKESIARDMKHMQVLHRQDTRQAVADAQSNAAQIHRLVSTFPVAAGAEAPQASFPKADRAAAAIEGVETVRKTRDTKQSARKRALARETTTLRDLVGGGSDDADAAPVQARCASPISSDEEEEVSLRDIL